MPTCKQKKELFEETLAIQEHYYRMNNHIEIASTLNWVVSARNRLGDYIKAKTLAEEALSIQNTTQTLSI